MKCFIFSDLAKLADHKAIEILRISLVPHYIYSENAICYSINIHPSKLEELRGWERLGLISFDHSEVINENNIFVQFFLTCSNEEEITGYISTEP